MDTIFPMGFPVATRWYLVLYIATLLMYIVFMNYVLAGTILLGAAGLRGRLAAERAGPIVTILKDWMPFALSAAITAGIAPLLFLQILYQREFYTANLLLFHRWMAILPALILLFYALYLLKAKAFAQRGGLRGLATVLAAAIVVFIAWSWTENHALSLHREAWTGLYESGSMRYRSPTTASRLSLWLAGAFPTMSVMLAWQLRWGSSGTSSADTPRAARPLAFLALAGIVLSVAAAFLYARAGGSPVTEALFSAASKPYLFAAAAGLLMQTVAWAAIAARRDIAGRWLTFATLGLGVSILGATVSREAIRLSTLDAAALEHQASAAGVRGLGAFLFFAAAALLAVAWVVRTVHKALRNAANEPPRST